MTSVHDSMQRMNFLRAPWWFAGVRKLHIPNIRNHLASPQCFRGSEGIDFEGFSNILETSPSPPSRTLPRTERQEKPSRLDTVERMGRAVGLRRRQIHEKAPGNILVASRRTTAASTLKTWVCNMRDSLLPQLLADV